MKRYVRVASYNYLTHFCPRPMAPRLPDGFILSAAHRITYLVYTCTCYVLLPTFFCYEYRSYHLSWHDTIVVFPQVLDLVVKLRHRLCPSGDPKSKHCDEQYNILYQYSNIIVAGVVSRHQSRAFSSHCCTCCLLPFSSAHRFSAEWILGRLRVSPLFGVFAVLQAPGVREVYHVRPPAIKPLHQQFPSVPCSLYNPTRNLVSFCVQVFWSTTTSCY